MWSIIYAFLLARIPSKAWVKRNFTYLIIVVLVIIILLMRSCDGKGKKPDQTVIVNGKPYTVVKYKVDTLYKTITQTVYKPGTNIYVDKPIYVNVPANVDTAVILKDYFAKYAYKDTLKLTDSLGYVVLFDTISQNKIQGRLWKSSINQKTIKETLIVKEPNRMQVYAGGHVGFEFDRYPMIGVDLALKTKKDHLYRINAGINSRLNPYIQGGMYWKISLRKNK